MEHGDNLVVLNDYPTSADGWNPTRKFGTRPKMADIHCPVLTEEESVHHIMTVPHSDILVKPPSSASLLVAPDIMN